MFFCVTGALCGVHHAYAGCVCPLASFSPPFPALRDLPAAAWQEPVSKFSRYLGRFFHFCTASGGVGRKNDGTPKIGEKSFDQPYMDPAKGFGQAAGKCRVIRLFEFQEVHN